MGRSTLSAWHFKQNGTIKLLTKYIILINFSLHGTGTSSVYCILQYKMTKIHIYPYIWKRKVFQELGPAAEKEIKLKWMSKTTNGDLYLLDSSVEDQVSMLPLDKDMISISFALNIT